MPLTGSAGVGVVEGTTIWKVSDPITNTLHVALYTIEVPVHPLIVALSPVT